MEMYIEAYKCHSQLTLISSEAIAVLILKTSLTNNLYGGLSPSGIKTGRVYQTSLEADEFKISDELNRRA